MEKTREKHLEQINKSLEKIDLALFGKPEHDDLEYLQNELEWKLEEIHGEVTVLKDDLEAVHGHINLEVAFYEMTSKLEWIHDEVRELKDEVADVKSQAEDLADSDRS